MRVTPQKVLQGLILLIICISLIMLLSRNDDMLVSEVLPLQVLWPSHVAKPLSLNLVSELYCRNCSEKLICNILLFIFALFGCYVTLCRKSPKPESFFKPVAGNYVRSLYSQRKPAWCGQYSEPKIYYNHYPSAPPNSYVLLGFYFAPVQLEKSPLLNRNLSLFYKLRLTEFRNTFLFKLM